MISAGGENPRCHVVHDAEARNSLCLVTPPQPRLGGPQEWYNLRKWEGLALGKHPQPRRAAAEEAEAKGKKKRALNWEEGCLGFRPALPWLIGKSDLASHFCSPGPYFPIGKRGIISL